jgi:hypothetical protein
VLGGYVVRGNFSKTALTAGGILNASVHDSDLLLASVAISSYSRYALAMCGPSILCFDVLILIVL